MLNNHRYFCKLTNEDLSKAVEELNEPENNHDRLERIEELRSAFYQECKDSQLIRDDDYFLLRFLRAKKFDKAKALKLLINYHKVRRGSPDTLETIKNPMLIKHVLDEGCFFPINGKAKDGSTVCIARPGKVKNADIHEFFAAAIASVEILLENEQVQIYGITLIEDFSYFGLNMAQQMGPLVAKRYLGWLQNAMPMRVKSINIVNEPKLFDVVFAIMRPFLKEKMKNRLQIHGNSFDLLHQIVDPAVLPPLFKGTGSNLDGEIIESWKKIVLGEETCI